MEVPDLDPPALEALAPELPSTKDWEQVYLLRRGVARAMLGLPLLTPATVAITYRAFYPPNPPDSTLDVGPSEGGVYAMLATGAFTIAAGPVLASQTWNSAAFALKRVEPEHPLWPAYTSLGGWGLCALGVGVTLAQSSHFVQTFGLEAELLGPGMIATGAALGVGGGLVQGGLNARTWRRLHPKASSPAPPAPTDLHSAPSAPQLDAGE